MTHPDLQRWLKKSTRGLDAELSDLIHEDITAHYEDALLAYQSEGYDLASAHRMAMCDLGDESAVGAEFRQVHYSQWRYLGYALVGLVYPIGYLLSIPLNEFLVGGIAFNLAIFLPMIYIVSSFRTLLNDRFSQIDIEKNIMLIRWGIILLCLTRFIGWRIYFQPTIVESYSRSIFEAVSMLEMGLNLVSIAGLLLASVGFMFIGEQTLHLREDFYGLLKPLGASIIVCGAGFAIYGLCSLVGQAQVCMIAEMVAVMAAIIATLTWSFIFWRERQIHMMIA
jgi:hypothetical protein